MSSTIPSPRRWSAAAVLAVLAIASCSSGDGTAEADGGASSLAAPTGTSIAPSTSASGETTTATGETPGSGAEPTDDADRETTSDPFPVQPAGWEGCGNGFECATVTVPLDHDRATGPTIDLALVRVASDDGDGDGVIGSIFVNPGGPGGSGVDYVRSGFRLDPATMDDFHLVGFDPRGVGASNPLRCGPGPDQGPLPDYDPDDDQERAELDDAARALADRCQELDGDLLPHLSTESVVADLDLLRRAVGDEQLTYLGFSYGTLIGLRYAEQHPDRVHRLILDGVVDPSTTLTGLLAQQASGFDRVFAAADTACGSAFACPDGGLAAAYDRLAARLDDEPVDGIGPTELAIGTLLSLYDESLWPRYADALDRAERGDVGGIRALYDFYATAADQAAYNAVVCADTPVPRGPEGWDDLEERLEQLSARFGAVLANEVRSCAHWPVRTLEAPGPVTADGIPPVLVLSTTGDAATPVENAVNVAATLAGAGLVTVDETSHTAYGRNFCVQQVVADYLATGTVPDAIHRC